MIYPSMHRPKDSVTMQTFFEVGMARDIEPLRRAPHRADGKVVALNLGAGGKMIDGTQALDTPDWRAGDRLPWKDATVNAVYAYHFLEHLPWRKVVNVLSECERVLIDGGVVNIVVPYGSGHLAVQDLTHRTFYNEDTWRTLMRNEYYDAPGNLLQFQIGFNMIMGAQGDNLALFTQLVRWHRTEDAS